MSEKQDETSASGPASKSASPGNEAPAPASQTIDAKAGAKATDQGNQPSPKSDNASDKGEATDKSAPASSSSSSAEATATDQKPAGSISSSASSASTSSGASSSAAKEPSTPPQAREAAKEPETQSRAADKPAVKAAITYRSHIQNIGWESSWKKDSETSGTSGKSLRMEALCINFTDKSLSPSIEYRSHVQNIGWEQSWKAGGSVTGTTGKGLRMEALQIRLKNDLANRYDVYYRVHVQNIGWMNWAKNGSPAGSEGKSLRIEAIQIKLIEKGAAAPSGIGLAFTRSTGDGSVNYRSHVQNVGWQGYVSDGRTAGTVGRGLRLEALNINVSNVDGLSIAYNAHVQNVGWQGWKKNGEQAGTVGQSLRVEALEIKLEGANASSYDVYYRVHAQNFGWMGWAKNGEPAGTSGCSLRLEALEVKLVKAGSAAPGSTATPYLSNDTISTGITCQSLVEGSSSWLSCGLGQTAGTTGQSKALLALKLSTSGSIAGGISYSTHLSNVGWTSAVSNGAVSGKSSKSHPVEAIKISLTGDLAKCYDVYYRAHVANTGWLGWAKNGAPAGSTGLSRTMEAYQVKLVVKGSAAPGKTLGALLQTQSLRGITSLIASAGSGLSTINTTYNLNSPAGASLQRAISLIRSTGKNVGFVMIDLTTGEGVSYNANTGFYSASSIKGPYVAAVNKYRAGSVGASVRNTMYQTITVSSNEGYASLRTQFGSGPMANLQNYVGGCSFNPNDRYCYMTPKDLAKLWSGCYWYFFKDTNGNSSWCRSLYTNPSMSFIHGSLGNRHTTYTKPGWISSGSYYLARNDAGIVMAGNRPYVLAVMSTAYGQDAALSNLVQAIDAVHSDMV
ncbi:hypothetical protein [Adlercreutzia sp. ZJ473]|uniref:hypothetical protein n=1 Tax=Adlercreutzia sp. ZJ473 TaxID=2722822 RepID=UPI001551FC8C